MDELNDKDLNNCLFISYQRHKEKCKKIDATIFQVQILKSFKINKYLNIY